MERIDNSQKTLFRAKTNKKEEEIEIYHDEGYENPKINYPFIHQFIATPTRSKKVFYGLLEEVRKKHHGENLSIKWKKIKKGAWNRNMIAKEWLELLSVAMRNEPLKWLGLNREPIILKEPLGVKISSNFINSLDNLSDSFYRNTKTPRERRRRKYESLMYMGIKGLTSFCFNPEHTNYSRVIIARLCTDGENGSIPIDNKRMINKLEWNLRDYVEIKTDKIEGIPKSKVKTEEVDFEELTDLVLGSTRYLCGYEERNETKDTIVTPLREIYNKAKRNRKGREASGHYRSFSVSECKINENNEMTFELLCPTESNINGIYQKRLNL